jgi:hypothetical protein
MTKRGLPAFEVDYWRLEFEMDVQGESTEPEDCILDLKGRIYVSLADRGERLAGRILLSLCRFAIGEFSPADALDAHSSDLSEYGVLFDGDDWNTMVMDQFECLGTDLLVPRKMEIAKRFRGLGLGLRVLRRSVDAFSGNCGLVAIKPFPLQFEGDVAGREQEFQSARDKLVRYYSRLGFEAIPGTDLMAFSPATTWPDMDAALRGLVPQKAQE